jgi:outer membrane murein-binding lipoprotein Lpp
MTEGAEMKKILILLMVLSPAVFASGKLDIEHFVNAKISVMTTRATELNHAVNLLVTGSLSDQEKFELIGQPSFKAVDDNLKQSGFTMKTYYEFAEQHEQEINGYLLQNPIQASEIDNLSSKLEDLAIEYDQLIQAHP